MADRPSTAQSASGRDLDRQHKADVREGRTTTREERPYLTTLSEYVRSADSPDEAFNHAFNAGRNAVLHAARTTRNPLAGVLSGADRQALIAILTREHSTEFPNRRAQVTRIAHALGLHLDA